MMVEKAIFCVCVSLYRASSAHLSDWVKKPLAIFSTNQKFSERKLIVLLTGFLHCEFALICDWFVCLTAHVVIGY